MSKITKTASGKYKARVYIGQDSTGHKKYRQISHYDKRILKTMVSEFEAANKNVASLDTFSVCLERYIDARDGIVSPSTIRGYKSIQNVLTTQYARFCKLPLASIGRHDIQSVINDLHNENKSGKYIKNIHGLISGVLIDNGHVSPKVALPPSKAKNVYEPTKDDIRRTIAAARGTTLEIPILLGVHGLRRGEICALRWPDDFDGNSVHISRDVVYGYKQELHTKTPKTARSDRIVPLASEVVELIREQGYVTHMTLAAISHAFPKLLAKNDIPRYRFHDLRHFFASYMHDQGFSDAQIMQMGGWQTDSVMKRVYRYALTDDGFADMVNSAVGDLL